VKLSAAQHKALRTIVDQYDRAIQSERTRWGEESAQFVANKGVAIVDISLRILHALEDRGLIRLKYGQVSGEKLRKGAFGRLIGGTRKSTDTAFFAAPTPLGIDAV